MVPEEPPSPDDPRAPALLVLPFDCNSLDTSLQFVADGLAEELIGRLACTQLSSMRIVSWTTAKTYRDKPMAAAPLSRKLGVRYLIEGSVLAAGERWRVDVRLVDAQADRVLFCDRFGCAGREVLLLQAQIAEVVAGHLSLVMAGDLTEPMWTQEIDPAAFLCYLDALRGFAEGSMQSLTTALTRLDEALVIAPTFMPATAMRGITLLQADNYHVRRDPEVVQTVRALGEVCLRQAPTLISTSLLDAGIASMYDFDWIRAESRLTKALKVMPSSVALRGRLANTLSIQRRHDDAASVFEPAHHLDRSVDVTLNDTRNKLWRRDYDGAYAGFDDMLRENPQNVFAHVMRVMTAFYQHDTLRARTYIAAQPASVAGQFRDLNQGCLAALENQLDLARSYCDVIEHCAQQGHGRWYYATMIDGFMGDAKAAGESLAHAAAAHEISCTVAAVDPSLDAVRKAPAVRSVIESMGLPA
jgi:TolB-like protein